MACRGPWVQVPSPPLSFEPKRSTPALSPAHEDVLAAVFGEGLAGEPAVQRLQMEPGDVEQAEPFVLGRPPERACLAAVEDEVDPIVADGVANGVWNGGVLVLAVELRGDSM